MFGKTGSLKETEHAFNLKNYQVSLNEIDQIMDQIPYC